MQRSRWAMLTTMAATMSVALAVLVSPVSAAFRADAYPELAGKEWFTWYIYGVGTGYGWANAELKALGHAPLFCQPAKMVLNHENYRDLLGRFLADTVRNGGDPKRLWLESLLLDALREAFPCKDTKFR